MDFERAEDVLALLRSQGVVAGDPLQQPLAQARQAQQRYLEFLCGEVPERAWMQDHTIDGPHGALRVRVLKPPAASAAQACIVYVRGAGWWAGSLDTSARTMAAMAQHSGLPVCAVDYRRTPEHHYPVQLDELCAAVDWLWHQGGRLGLPGQNQLLWGESAGATLAVCAARKLVGVPQSPVRGLLLHYGNFVGPGVHTRALSRWVWQQYLAGVAVHDRDGAIALRGSLAGLAPCWLGVGDADPLLADSVAFGEKLREAGVAYDLKVYAGMPHGFVGMSRLLVPARRAVKDACDEGLRMLGMEHQRCEAA